MFTSPEEGIEPSKAFGLSGSVQTSKLWVKAELSENAPLGEDESFALYSVKNNELGEKILDDIADGGELCPVGEDVSGVVLMKDTGYRHLSLDVKAGESGSVLLDGMMPKNAAADAVDKTDIYQQNDGDNVIAAYDISISNMGRDYQPTEDKPISVEFKNQGLTADSKVGLWHIKDDGTREKVENFTLEDGKIKFEAKGFSVYEVVSVEEKAIPEAEIAHSVDDLKNGAFYLYNDRDNNNTNYYFCGETGDSNPVKISKTKNEANAALWHFDLVEGTANHFLIYTEDIITNERKYMAMDTPSCNMSLEDDVNNATEFVVECYANNSNPFYIYKQAGSKNYGINQRGGTGGKGFAGYSGKDNGSKIEAKSVSVVEDPCNLNGKEFGLVASNGSSFGAMMSETKVINGSGERRVAKAVTIRPNPAKYGDVYISNDDITTWKFQSIPGTNKYYVTTVYNGIIKYLKIVDKYIYLADTPDNDCILNVTLGTGDYAGKIRISNLKDYAPYFESVSNGFSGSKTQNNQRPWFYLVEKSSISLDDYVIYSADKIDVSDIKNGDKIVMYLRKWDEENLRYNFYVLNYDGYFYPAYTDGDNLKWYGSAVNSALWEFTEYYYEGTTTPNNYYEFQNTYSGSYLAPQILDGQVLKDSVNGVNLNGRRDGEYGSTIVAWDNIYYQYAALKYEDGTLVSCPWSEGDTFFFAKVNENEERTKVDTVDNNEHGITMKMVNFDGKVENGRDAGQTAVMGVNSAVYTGQDKPPRYNLVSHNLQEDGYPVATETNRSLSELFANAKPANHLFLEKTYNESGYFEYNCTYNFAHLNKDGNFSVYDQVATIQGETSKYYKHGQFMPYNTLYVDSSHISNQTNQTSENCKPLSDDDPRKGKTLYYIPINKQNKNNQGTTPETEVADYYFGMELEAAFTQTVSGLDAWGHDMIFEFTGDDDFWFFVDGVLVMDLGGVHDAASGTVNFKTGNVQSDGQNNGKTLLQIFRENYIYNMIKGREGYTAGLETSYKPTEDEKVAIDNYLSKYFDKVTNPATGEEEFEPIFKDYSNHKMKILYMERGAGASTLRLRFNLSSVKPGQVELNKSLENADDLDYSLVEFPFQVFYRKNEEGASYVPLTNENQDFGVFYKRNNQPVDFRQTYLPLGCTPLSESTAEDKDGYKNVFVLIPGQTAVIAFPDNTLEYYIVECGVNTEVFSKTSCNGDVIDGTDSKYSDVRKDFGCAEAKVEDRQFVNYVNTVDPNSLRTLEIKKTLLDENGNELFFENDDTSKVDKTTFDFRLYLDSEQADAGSLALASMHPYYVKNGDKYCKWDPKNGCFATTEYTKVDEENKSLLTFETSPNGAISKIPAGFTVAVPNIPVYTKFKVEERESEIPKGYKFVSYTSAPGSFYPGGVISDGDTDTDLPNAGYVRPNA